MRYSIKKVITGYAPKLNKEEMSKHNGKIAIFFEEKAKERICVVDKKKREVIDIFEPDEKFPILGYQKNGYIETEKDVDENTEYALKIGNRPFSYITAKQMIKQMHRKGQL